MTLTFRTSEQHMNDLTKWRENHIYDLVQCIMGYRRYAACDGVDPNSKVSTVAFERNREELYGFDRLKCRRLFEGFHTGTLDFWILAMPARKNYEIRLKTFQICWKLKFLLFSLRANYIKAERSANIKM